MRRRSVPSCLLVVPLLLGATAAPSASAASVDAGPTTGTTALRPAQLEVVETADGDPGRTVACAAPYELDPTLGCVRPVGDGLLEFVGPDGEVGTTHGADTEVDHSHADGDEHLHGSASPAPDAVTSSRSRTELPTTRRPVVCAGAGTARAVVLHVRLRGTADRRATHAEVIRRTLERSNQAVAVAAARSGGPAADLRVACDADGRVAVRSLVVTSRAFGDVKAAVRSAGYARPLEKYLVFADFGGPDPAVSGVADLFRDDRRSVDNHNNGRYPMYALVYGAANFEGRVALHELAHTMGAVQAGAPGADGTGHCRDGQDVLCAGTGGGCVEVAFDCGNDTYFSTATRPGEWLHSRWNLGWEGNRFVALGGDRVVTTASPGAPFRDIDGSPHRRAIVRVADQGIAEGFADGTFRPNLAVTRAQMATFLARALDLDADAATRGFADVAGSVHDPSVRAITHHGVTEGFPDGTFRPADGVTRGQLASFLARALELPPPARGTGTFPDTRGSTHEAAIDAVSAAGITEGFGDGTFRPGARVTRGQMASFLVRALDG